MLAQLALSALLAIGSSAAPTKRGTDDLRCVNQQYTGPFTATGLNGYIHLYANVTTFDSSTQTTSFNETRLGISEDGTLQNCGDCRSTQQFGFEVCQGPDRKGFDGLGNSPNNFYGHILYTTDQADLKCLQAQTPYNGSSVTAVDCQYDYEGVGTSGQYWKISISDEGGALAFLVSDQAGETFGVNPDISEGGKLTLWDGPPSAPFTYLGFKAPVF